jgi:hypothetical protein
MADKPWKKQEKRLAKKVSGSRPAASGAFWTRKGDVRSEDLLIEAKQTDKKSFSLVGTVWDKIRREALLDGRMPVLAVQIQNRNLVVIDEEDFLELHSNATRHLGEGAVP